MANPKSRAAKAAPGATVEEIEAAVAALSAEDLYRLDQYGRRRIERIGAAADTRNHEDLLGEAYRLMLEGNRAWPRDVGLVAFLCGVMKSVSSHWAETYGREQDAGRRDVRTDFDVRIDHIDGETGTDPRIASGFADEVAAVKALFAEDPTASNILAGIMEGCEAAEVAGLLEISQTAYESKLRDMRRKMIRAGLKRPTKTQKGPSRG